MSIDNPFESVQSRLNRLTNPLAGIPGMAERPQPMFQPLPPEEEESLLAKAARYGLGGLGWLGEALSKGGRAVRGTISGLTGGDFGGGLLNLIPFSDTAGWTDPQNQVTGRNFLEHFGALEKGVPGSGLDVGDVAGFATDVLTDPLTFLTTGAKALNPLGELAKKAGINVGKLGVRGRMAGFAEGTPEAEILARKVAQVPVGPLLPNQIAEVANKPLGGAIGFRLPFQDPWAAPTSISGPLATAGEYIAGSPVGQAFGAATKPIRLGWNALFNHEVQSPIGGRAPMTMEGQGAARLANEYIGKNLPGAAKAFREMAEPVRQAGLWNPEGIQKVSPLVRQSAEDVLMGPHLPETEALLGPVRESANYGRQYLEKQFQEMKELGVPTGYLENYWPRQQQALERSTKGFANPAVIPTGSRYQLQRLEAFTTPVTLPSVGPGSVEDLIKNPELRHLIDHSPNILPGAEYIRANYLGVRNDDQFIERLGKLARNFPPRMVPSQNQLINELSLFSGELPDLLQSQVNPLTKELNPLYDEFQRLSGIKRQSEDLASIIKKSDPAYMNPNVPYWQNAFTDFKNQAAAIEKVKAGATATYDTMYNPASKSGIISDHLEMPDGVPLRKALEDMGLKTVEVPGGQSIGAAKQIADRLGVHPSDIDDYVVPKSFVDDMARYHGVTTSSSGATPFVKLIDTFTNLFRAWTTRPWPGFNVRNSYQGLFQNYITGAKDPNATGPIAYIKPYQYANNLRNGEIVPIANKAAGLEGLNAAQATRRLSEEFFDLNPTMGSSGRQTMVDVSGRAAGALPEVPYLPGEKMKSFMDIAKGYMPRSLEEANPLNVAGVGERNVSKFAPVRAGEEFNRSMDEMGHMAHFIARRLQGYEPEIANNLAKVALYDFSLLAPFERDFMRRVVPWYGWMRRNIPFTIQNLMEEPGGKLATVIKGTAAMRNQQEFVPEYLGEGIAIPIGSEKEGTQRFLSRTGLPFEDVTDKLHPNIGRFIQGLIGETNPLIKMPIELAAGKQMFTGRPLQELHGLTGNTLADQAIMNSPLARVYTTGRTIFDPRKYDNPLTLPTNLLTGLKVSDVNMERQRELAAQDAIRQQLQGKPGVKVFSKPYVSKEDLDKLSAEDILLMRLGSNLEKRARERKKKEAETK